MYQINTGQHAQGGGACVGRLVPQQQSTIAKCARAGGGEGGGGHNYCGGYDYYSFTQGRVKTRKPVRSCQTLTGVSNPKESEGAHQTLRTPKEGTKLQGSQILAVRANVPHHQDLKGAFRLPSKMTRSDKEAAQAQNRV